MSEPARGFHSSLSRQSSLPQRIRENLQSLRAASRIRLAAPIAANAVPIHLLESPNDGRLPAQTGSTALHVLAFAAILFLMAHPPRKDRPAPVPGPDLFPKLFYPTATPAQTSNTNNLGKAGSGGDHSLLPPTNGELPPTSRVVFASPRPIDNPNPKLPVTTAIYAADAPDFMPPVASPGLPWAPDKNGSGGPGKNAIGVGEVGGVGDKEGTGVGRGHDGPYSVAATPVACKYCPDPQYSDEARKTKLQGHVTLHVLVGADGRAKEIGLAQGLGMGLDDNAIDAVRHWQFIPARDANRRPIASWITIETVFRLF